MNLRIILENKKTTIELKENRKIIDALDINDINNLSKMLLKNIDSLLKKNKIRKDQIKKISIRSAIPNSYTSSRIIKSFKKTCDFALNLK
ncbi:MAG: hypothetical protein WC906_00525 [Parcubacteria group bacterium]|jgi:tRNA A37 threonylcarbamoyladenosine modification protein TsaB